MHIDLLGVLREGFWYSGMRTAKLGNIFCDYNEPWYLYTMGLSGTYMFLRPMRVLWVSFLESNSGDWMHDKDIHIYYVQA